MPSGATENQLPYLQETSNPDDARAIYGRESNKV